MDLWNFVRNSTSKGIQISVSIPIERVDFKPVRDLLTLLDAIHFPLCRPEYQPYDGKTFCNAFVAEVCEIYGYKGLNGLLANEIIDLVSQSPNWSEVPLDKCQDLANAGSLIILGLKGDVHGHVDIVCPGRPKSSGRFGTVATVANVGKENWIGKGWNWAFSDAPKAWAWRSTL